MTIKADALYTSAETGDHHATPQDLYDKLDGEFHFRLDPCASKANHKAPVYCALDHDDEGMRDGLAADWHALAEGYSVFMNPPYGRGVGEWMAKAMETARQGTTVVCLIHARTDTRWFHDTVMAYEHGVQVRFVRKRVRFGGQKHAAPFPSLVVVFWGKDEDSPRMNNYTAWGVTDA